jgi:HAE1 family hydrophobic/amphiphilic exporter-1
VLFVQEEAGQLFRDIALAISSAVGLSLIVSITVIPTSAARLLRAGKQGETAEHDSPTKASRFALLYPLDAAARRFVDLVVGLNALLQRSVALRLATVLAFVGVSLLLSWLMMPKVEYLPTGNRNLVFVRLLPPPGYNIDQMMELGRQLEEGTRPYWDVDKHDPRNAELEYPPIDNYFYVGSSRFFFFGMRAMDPLRAREFVPLMQELGAQLQGTIAFAAQTSLFSRDVTGARSVDVEVTGPELTRLVDLSRQIFADVTRVIPGARPFPRPSLDLVSPEVHVLRKSQQATDMQVSTGELGYTVDALVDGAYAADYFIGGDKIDLSIVGNDRFARRTQDVASLPVATPTGELVELEGLAEVRLSGGPEQINHRERERTITIQVTPPPEMPLEQAIDTIRAEIVQPLRQSGQIGGEYRIRLAGTADKLRATWNALRWNLVLALLITYLLMAALFESWLYPFVIIFSVPLGAAGGFLGLAMLNAYLRVRTGGAEIQSLDVLTMLGFVILIGTVVNNAILIVHQSLNHMRDEAMPHREAILASVRTRIRPIFMTTSTTVLGLSPLVLFPGAGQELYRGLGAVVLGGLIVSTLFTLVLVPTLFSLMMEAKIALVRSLGLEAPPAPSACG